MMCNRRWNRFVSILMICVGTVSLLFGVLMFGLAKPEGHAANTLMGMFAGFGAGILGVAIARLIRAKTISEEKREQEEIERQDERNIAIMRAAGLASFYVAVGLLALLVFLFMGLGYRVPSFICLGAMYLLVASAWITRWIFSRKM